MLQQLDYLAYIDLYHDRIRCFHVKDAEFRPNGRVEIGGWDRNTIEVTGTKYASSKEALAAIKVDMHESAGVFESAIYKERGGRQSNGDWQKNMTNWHRNLYEGGATPEVPAGSYLLYVDEKREAASWRRCRSSVGGTRIRN